jgi:hypothetical protein
MSGLINQIREEFISIWTLLNDTEIFLKRTNLHGEYEIDFRVWRTNLNSHHKNQPILNDIREEIVLLRKSLRSQGYDLRLGSKDIIVNGFISDDAPRYGFQRLTLVISKTDIFYITGTSNHQELKRYLEIQLGVTSIFSVGELHSLWYRWKNNILEIRGADSEPKDELEKFTEYVEKNKLFVLKKLKKL